MTTVAPDVGTSPRTLSAPLAGSSDLAFAFEEAAARVPVVEVGLRIADREVRLHVAGEPMAQRLTRAFAHLAAPAAATPDLDVYLWDSADGRTAAPPRPSVGDEHAPGAFFTYSDDRIRVGFERGVDDAPAGTRGCQAPTPALSAYEPESRRAWHWVADTGRIPYWAESSPLRFVLDWWLSDLGLQQVHSGAVGTEAGGVLLVGKSGSGKSTSSLSVLGSALGYAGDDYVAVSVDGRPWVHSLYSSGKVMPDHLHRLPHLAGALCNNGALDVEKAVLYVNEHWPDSVVRRFPLRAVLLPRVVRGQVESRVRPTTMMAALTALAPSTVLQLRSSGADSLARMSRLARSVPCYVLELGSDIDGIPRVVAALIDELATGAC